MRPQRGRGTFRGRGPNNQRLQREIRSLKHDINGHKTTPSVAPHAFVQLPWNSWTYEATIEATEDFEFINTTVASVCAQIRLRLSLESTADIRIKVQSAQVWCTASSLIFPDLECFFYELNGESNQNIARYHGRDKGTLNLPARVGYSYPIVDKREIIRESNSGSKKILTARPTATDSNVTIRIQLLWQASPQ